MSDAPPSAPVLRINLVRDARDRLVAYLTNRDPGDEQDDEDTQ